FFHHNFFPQFLPTISSHNFLLCCEQNALPCISLIAAFRDIFDGNPHPRRSTQPPTCRSLAATALATANADHRSVLFVIKGLDCSLQHAPPYEDQKCARDVAHDRSSAAMIPDHCDLALRSGIGLIPPSSSRTAPTRGDADGNVRKHSRPTPD